MPLPSMNSVHPVAAPNAFDVATPDEQVTAASARPLSGATVATSAADATTDMMIGTRSALTARRRAAVSPTTVTPQLGR